MGKSLRALHWAESKHPRDDRGRFSRKGGGKWVERVGEQAKAAFGDVNLGYEVGRGPAGRLQTGKGGLIDIGGLHKAAKAVKAAQAPSVGRPGGGEKVNPQSLSVGDRFLNAQGVEHEVLSNPVTGRRAGAAVARMKVRRVSDSKEGPLTLNGQVTKLDTARVPEQSGGMKSTTEIDTRRAGADATGRDRGALARSAGGVMSKEAAGRHNTAAMKLQDQQKATPEQLAGVLRKHGLEAVAKDVDAGRYSKAATKLHDHTLDAMRNAPFEKRQEVRGVYNDLSRMPDDIGDAEDLDGMTVEKLGREWVVNDTSKDGKTVHMYGSTSKADAEDWARTAAASRLAMRASDVSGSHAIHADRQAALSGGEGRIYRPQGSVAKVSATSAAERKADLQAKIKAHRAGTHGGNADGGNFADELRKEMGSQNDLAKATARGRTPAGAKLPTTSGGNIDAKPARTDNRELRTNSEVKTPMEAIADVGGDVRVGRTASGDKVETPKPTGIERVMKARSNSEKSAAFKELTADQIVEAFQRDPGKALDAYMQKNFGKDSGRANALPDAVDNIAANLKAGDITPEQAAEQMRQWARLHAGMQHHRYMTLAADLLDGTVAKRRENKITPNAEGGNVEAPKVEPRRYQTFADRMAGDMTDADRRAGHAESDRRRAELRAQEAEQARQRAEAEANDTRSEREKLTQKLRDAYTVREIGMRSGRLDPKREAAIKTAEARLAAMDTEDRHAKIKELGVVKGDTIKTPLGEFEVTGTTKDGYLRIVRPDGRRGSVAPKNVESVTKGSVLPKADAGGSPGADGRVSEVTIWNSDTRRPERTERRTVKVVGLDQVGTPEERATIERSIDAGLSAYRAGYRPPTFEVTKTGVESLGAHYDQFGLRVGKDRVRIHPSHAEHRAEQLPHTIRHEIAHRAEWVLRAKVEARDGVDAAETWKRNVDRATLAWLDRARREAPDDPRLKYASLTQHFRDTGHAHEVGDPADEAFADLVGHLADGEEVPGDPSEVLALIRGADPAGIFTESRDTTKVDTPRVSVQASEMTANDDTKSPFKMGQRVEVLAHDFTKPGQPREWKPGKVTGVQPQDNGRHDIMVTADDGTRHPHIVGVRGGNKNVRAAGQAPTTVATTEEIRSGQAGDHLRHFERDAASGVDTDVLRAVRDDERAPANFRTAARSELARRGAGPRGEELTRLREQGRKREQGIGPTPEVTGYVKGREVRPGMLINAADLLGMHERQGSTTGENPNPLGHAEWVRVGLIGNTNEKGFRQWGEGTLTGGMYVVLDTSGRPVGRMSANTIAEMSGTLDGAPEHMLDTVRMPAKVAKTVTKRGPDGKMVETIEMVDGFEAVHVPSKAAQEELGLPTPKMRSNGILDPADPNYGANATHPTPAHRPFGRPVKGSRTRAEAAADRAKRREVYASGETERAQRRAEAEAQRKADAAATREQQRIEDEKKLAASREQYRRDTITRRHEQLQRDLARTDPEVYDRSINNVRSGTPEEFAAQRLTQGSSDLKWLASAYGLKTRGTTVQEQADGIVAAVKAGKTPDLEVGAPKVLGETEQAAAEAKKIATADKRRRNEVTKNFDTLKVAIQADEKDPRFNWSGKPDPRVADHFSLYMSETQMRQLAEAFGLEALTGRALRDAIVEAIKAGRQPDLSAAPITSLKKSRR